MTVRQDGRLRPSVERHLGTLSICPFFETAWIAVTTAENLQNGLGQFDSDCARAIGKKLESFHTDTLFTVVII